MLNDGFIECVDACLKTIFKIDVKIDGANKYEVVRGVAYFDNRLVFVDAYDEIKLFNSSDGNEIWSTNINYPICSLIWGLCIYLFR